MPVNDAVRVSTVGLLSTAELAARPDFTLGLAAVSPSTRNITGPGGTADVEPRAMQVLVVLADAGGQVVTRETLFNRCWGSVYDCDDSLNRIIEAIRKLAADVAGGSFEVETIPRTGYRLAGATAEVVGQNAFPKLSRRDLAGAAVAVIALAAGGIGWSAMSREDARFKALIDQANDQLVKRTADEKTAELLDQAIAMRPDSPKAWGLLALLKSSLVPASDSRDSTGLVDESEHSARRALSLDAKQPDALLAMFQLQGSTLTWIERDRKLRQIVAIDPNSVLALAELALFTAATGLTRESWTWNERGLALEPLSPIFLGTRALKLWVFGRMSEADKVSDQLRGLYPMDEWPWFVRAQIYAFTGRARAALGMLDAEPVEHGHSAIAKLWRAALPAVDYPSPGNLAKARDACVRGAKTTGMVANEAVLIMSGLGELDTAFDIADGSLLSRGPLVEVTEDADWRVGTQWMWAPPVAAMRADPRFLPLCRAVGLTDYWKQRGVNPDYTSGSVP
jgi:DNA-binding winged helix-turn-helix (wHTH) protein